jgi:hypothetical protein
MKCLHEQSKSTRDGKECVKCGLKWSLALKEKREWNIMKRPQKHLHNPKWIPPEKRMEKYKDYGITNQPTSDPVWDKLRWTKFKIVVPTEQDKKNLQAAFEYLHDSRDIDTDFIVVNQLVHEYEHGDASDKHSNIVVSPSVYHDAEQKTCIHDTTYIEDGIRRCTSCDVFIEITSFRGQ